MAIAEPDSNNTTKYWITDTQLQLLADAIRKESGTTALLTYPDGFVSAINSLNHVKTETLNVTWPKTFNEIYWTTQTELQNIANAIRSKNSSSETLTFLEDFVNNLVTISENGKTTLGTITSFIDMGDAWFATSNSGDLYNQIKNKNGQIVECNFVGAATFNFTISLTKNSEDPHDSSETLILRDDYDSSGTGLTIELVNSDLCRILKGDTQIWPNNPLENWDCQTLIIQQ